MKLRDEEQARAVERFVLAMGKTPTVYCKDGDWWIDIPPHATPEKKPQHLILN